MAVLEAILRVERQCVAFRLRGAAFSPRETRGYRHGRYKQHYAYDTGDVKHVRHTNRSAYLHRLNPGY